MKIKEIKGSRVLLGKVIEDKGKSKLWVSHLETGTSFEIREVKMKGELCNNSYKEGDKVVVQKYQGITLYGDYQDCILIEEEYLLGKVEG